MPKPLLPTLMRRIIALAMVVAIVAFGTHAVSSGAGVGSRPADSASSWSAAGDHGHSHDDGEDDGGDRLVGHAHAHGHTHADHSHDTVASGGPPRIATDARFASWRVTASDPAAGRRLHPPDRPPRSEAAV